MRRIYADLRGERRDRAVGTLEPLSTTNSYRKKPRRLACAMLVLAAFIEPSPRWHVPIALALLPHIAVGIALLSSLAYIAWIHVSAARRRRATLSSASIGNPEERQRLVPDSPTPEPAPSSFFKHERSQALTGRHLVLDVLKITLATAAVTTSLVRLVGLEDAPHSKWTRVYQGGILACVVSWPLQV